MNGRYQLNKNLAQMLKGGVIMDVVNVEEAKTLLESGYIQKGMIPKVKSALRALEGGVKKVHFLNGKQAHSILLEIFTDSGIGTEFVSIQNDKRK